ncbi:MAG: hypothetical protein OXF88_12210, partial [Rhodobacteraceae bacterium]|nr:hypothetical protein [Paracoccaceae bacterium]
MSARSERKIRTRTVRSMPGPAHYRFRRKLAWMCRKYGKRLVIANEAYTSRTRPSMGRFRRAGARRLEDGLGWHHHR